MAWRISIHAPRAGSDGLQNHEAAARVAISIHAPRAGSDCNTGAALFMFYEFQSTLPVRGATFLYEADGEDAEFQSTLPVRGATKKR